MTLLPEPQSPISPSRTLKGESIRSLRELLQASLSSLPEDHDTDTDTDDKEKRQQRLLANEKKPGLLRQVDVDADTEKQRAETNKNGGTTTTSVDNVSLQQASSRRAADEVRSRLLQNLGIQKQLDPAISTANPPLSISEPWGPSYTVPLNDCHAGAAAAAASSAAANNGTSCSTATATSSCESANSIITTNMTTATTTTTEKSKKCSLQFHPTVQVYPIPSHKVYSNRIKQTIWAGAYELSENVARNSLEFSYEDWDADHVLDEDTGLIYSSDCGEWIHPVHFDIPPENVAIPLSSDEIWKQTCERLGIQPAEFYHSLPTTTPSS